MFLHLFHERAVVADSYDPKPIVPQLGADLRVRLLLPKSIVMRSVHKDANTWEVSPVVGEIWLDMHSGGGAVLALSCTRIRLHEPAPRGSICTLGLWPLRSP